MPYQDMKWLEAVKGAVATNEVNAAMGIICATQQLDPPERFRAYYLN